MDAKVHENRAKGNRLVLLIVSIVLIVIGIIGTGKELYDLVTLDQVLSGESFMALAAKVGISNSGMRTLMTAITVEILIECVLSLVAGVCGFLLWRGKNTATACEILSIIILCVMTLSVIGYVFIFGPEFVDWPITIVWYISTLIFACLARVESKELSRKRMHDLTTSAFAEKIGMVESHTAYNFIIITKDSISGTIAIPMEKFPDAENEMDEQAGPGFVRSNFQIENDELHFHSSDQRFNDLVEEFMSSNILGMSKVGSSGIDKFAAFLGFMMMNDSALLISWRDKLHMLEDIVNSSKTDAPEGLDDFARNARHSLHSLRRFYQQLEDMCHTIGTTTEIELTDRQRAQFAMLANRAERFAGEAEHTAEYASQITAMQQAMVNAKHTEISTVLTVVATICMSVSLLTSWYGMNLKSMPEQNASFTYVVVIFICIIIVAAELVYFKRKKWF